MACLHQSTILIWMSSTRRKKDKRELITEADVAAIFNNGSLTKTEAAKQLEEKTGRASLNVLSGIAAARSLREAPVRRRGKD